MSLEIKETKYKGRGIFTNKKIKAGEIVEVCPIIEIPRGNIVNNPEGQNKFKINWGKTSPMQQLGRYMFSWTRSISAIALGYGSLYNHNNLPNLRYTPNYNKNTIIFKAIRDIEKGEELTISYESVFPGSDQMIKTEKKIEKILEQEIPKAQEDLKKRKKFEDQEYKRIAKIYYEREKAS